MKKIAAPDGSIIIDSQIDSSGVQRGVGEIKSSMRGLGSTVKKVGMLLLSAFAIKQLINFGKECLELGSSLEEVQNVVDVTFPNMTKRVDEFARAAADSFGLSETMAKKYAGTFGSMAKAFGYSEEAAFDMATALTGLTGDVASFYNLSQEEAYTKLKSVFTGETESLKELGVVMTQNALDQYALANGYGKTTAKMTEQEKVALRLKFVQAQLSAANGDFARTSDSWANQVRIFQLRIQSLKATIGQGLINLFTPIIKSINILLEKLSVATNAFKNFTEVVMGKKSVPGSKQSGSHIKDLQSGYEGATEGAEDFADGVKDANKEVKKAQAPFDDLIQLQQKSQDVISTPANQPGIEGGALPPELSTEASQQTESPFLNNVMELLDGIKVRLSEIGSIFKGGFFQGLGNFKPMLAEMFSDLQKIGGYLKDIFADKDVMDAASRFIKSFVEKVGKLVGAITSIGLTIATNLVGGIESYLSGNTERIKQWLIRMFDVEAEMHEICGNFFVAFADVFSVFSSQTAQDITGSIIQIFMDVFGGVLELTWKFMRDVSDMILTPFVENKDKIKQAIAQTLEPIKVVVQSIATTIRKLVDGIVQLYDEHIHPLFESIKTGLSELLDKLLDGYNKYIVPVLDKLAAKFKEVMEGPVGEAIESALNYFGKLVDAIKLLWENILVPFLGWIIDTMYPMLAPIIHAIGMIFLDSFGGMAEVVTAVFDVLSSLIDFVVSVFAGDWKKAWESVKKIFKGIWDGFHAIVETKIKAIMDLVNGLVESIGNAVKKVIDFFNKGSKADVSFSSGNSGKSSSFFSANPDSYPMTSFAAIPYNPPMLATGTVVPPRAGISYFGIGDNNHEPEVVSPLSTIKQAIKEVFAENGIAGDREIHINMHLNDQVFARAVYKANNQEKQRVGVRLVSQNV